MKIFQHPHGGKQFLLGDAVICLGSILCHTVAAYYLLLSILYLGQHSANATLLTSVSTMNLSLGCR
jgi:hypothetical protein